MVRTQKPTPEGPDILLLLMLSVLGVVIVCAVLVARYLSVSCCSSRHVDRYSIRDVETPELPPIPSTPVLAPTIPAARAFSVAPGVKLLPLPSFSNDDVPAAHASLPARPRMD